MRTQLILYHHSNDVPSSDLAAVLVQMPDIRVELIDPTSLTVWDDNWPIRVSVEKEVHVLVESREIAALAQGVSEADQGVIATCDCRLEVMYEPDPEMRTFNTWLLTIERLSALVHGIAFDPTDCTILYNHS